VARLLAAGLLVVLTACSTAATRSTAPTATPAVDGSASSAAPSSPAVAEPPSDAPSAAPTGPVSPAPAAAGEASCGRVRRPPLQSGSHLIGDQPAPVPYSSRPPTSGWHASGHVTIGVRGSSDALTEPQQVSVLEAGAVVVSHGQLSARDRRRLVRRVQRRHDGRVAVTPYAQLDEGQMAFTSWGVLQRCGGVDLAALDAFVDHFGPDTAVETGH
jgi:hypothetical protein